MRDDDIDIAPRVDDGERRADEALAASARELRLVADGMPALVAYVRADLTYGFVNQAYADWFDLAPEHVVGRPIAEVVGPDAFDELQVHARTALAGEIVQFRSEVAYARGGPRFIDATYVPDPGPDRILGFVAYVRDVTESHRAEQRLQFLAEASRALASTLDVDQALETVVRVAVPRIADGCLIEALDEDGRLVPRAHHDDPPDVLSRALELRRRFLAQSAASGVFAVLRTERPVLRQIDAHFLRQVTDDPEERAALEALGLDSVASVPIPTTRGVFGVLSLTTGPSGRRLETADLALAEELAARLGLAIDNARLFAELRAADRAKDEFLAMLGHELRNPLAPMLLGLHVLASRGPTDEQGRVIEVLQRQAHTLSRLVDDMLDVSRITRGKIELRTAPCLLADVIGRAVETSAPKIDARGHALEVEVPDGVRILADVVRLEQVFANLLNNAAKYTDPGGRLRVDATVDDAFVHVRVVDDGIGIPRDVLPHIFHPFRQGKVTLDRSQGGLGLGLTLVDRIVALHGGRVEARSDGPGAGATFTVSLPRLP